MMQKTEKMMLAEDWCWKVYVDTETKVMEAEWFKQEDLNNSEFMAYLQKWAEFVEHYQPVAFLVDSRQGHKVITPDLQEWHDQTIVPSYIRGGVRKIAFILPQDIFAVVSLEQTFSEENALNELRTGYFEDSQKAREWLLQKNDD